MSAFYFSRGGENSILLHENRRYRWVYNTPIDICKVKSWLTGGLQFESSISLTLRHGKLLLLILSLYVCPCCTGGVVTRAGAEFHTAPQGGHH